MLMLANGELTWIGGLFCHWSDSSSDSGVYDVRFRYSLRRDGLVVDTYISINDTTRGWCTERGWCTDRDLQ